MKKIKLLAFILVLISSVTNAQFNKGSLLLGADLSFSTGSSSNGINEDKSHGFNISPTLAVATKLNTFWGGSINAGYFKNESQSPTSNSSYSGNNYGASIFCRKYKQVAGKLFAFVQGGLSAGFSKQENKNVTASFSENKNNNIGLVVIPGISFYISKKVYLEAGFSNIARVDYSWGKTSNHFQGTTTTSKSNGFSFSSSLGNFSNNLYFGFRIIIPKSS